MPRVVPKRHPFTADDVVVAWQSFAWDGPEGRPYTITPSMRLRGDHPAVVANPAYFSKADLPSAEVPNLWDHVSAPVQPEPEYHRVQPPIPDDEAAVCMTAFQIGFGGKYVAKNQRLRRDDPLVTENPEFFRIITVEKIP
jgi:hypothetical protein